MAFITINYEDGNGQSYESVEIQYGVKSKKIFNSGNFIKDWYDMRKFMIQKLVDKETHFACSSSIDHFIMDGAPYDSAYLHMVDDKPVLKYIDRSNPDWWKIEGIDDGLEFFVPENTQPTWKELKEMCK